MPFISLEYTTKKAARSPWSRLYVWAEPHEWKGEEGQEKPIVELVVDLRNYINGTYVKGEHAPTKAAHAHNTCTLFSPIF